MKKLLLFQGIFYLITALWPLFHMKSFEALAGPKKEKWLVYTVSALLIGPSLIFSYVGINEAHVEEVVVFLSISLALGLALIDVIFVLKGVIWKTYLVDAAVEAAIIILALYFRLSGGPSV